MKRFFFLLLALVTLLSIDGRCLTTSGTHTSTASSQIIPIVELTSGDSIIQSSDNYLYVESFTIVPGMTKTIPVYLHSTVPIWSFQVDFISSCTKQKFHNIQFSDEFIQHVTWQDFTIESSLLSGAGSGTFRVEVKNESRIHFIPASERLHVFNLTISIPNTVAFADWPFRVRNFLFVNADNGENMQGANKPKTMTVTNNPDDYHITAPDLTVTPSDTGRVYSLPLTLTMPQGGNFINFLMLVTFPEGLKPACDEDGRYCYLNEELNNPETICIHDMDRESSWPRYTFAISDASRTPKTNNPCHLITLNVTPTTDFVPGNRDMMIYLDYIDADDIRFKIGTSDYPVKLTTIHFTDTIPGDVNNDGLVDVEDVNALISIILELNVAADYCGNTNVDGDATGKIDINDLNALINLILAQ